MTSLGSQQSAVSSQNGLSLVVQLPDGQEMKHALVERETTIGRDPENGICIPHAFVSNFHAKLVRYGDAITLVDLRSVNKTRVNGRPVLQKELRPGDEIEFAGVKSRLVEISAPETDTAGKPVEVFSSPEKNVESSSLKKKSASQSAVSKLPALAVVLLLILMAAYLAAQVF
jgi:pSer/pThr/pTyr-binding forkhead associated (FHA) protein